MTAASSTIRPSSSVTAAVQRSSAASAASWVTRITVLPPSRFSSWSSARISRAVRLSRLPVGSSASRISGIVGQGAGDGDALLLAARELLRPVRCRRAPRPTRASSSRARAFALGARHAGEHHRQRHVLQRGHRRDEVERLEDHPDVRAAVKAELARGTSRPGRWPNTSSEPAVGRSSPAIRLSSVDLPEPGGAEQAEKLAARNGQRHAVERADDSLAHRVVARKVAGVDGDVHGGLFNHRTEAGRIPFPRICSTTAGDSP